MDYEELKTQTRFALNVAQWNEAMDSKKTR